MRKVSFVTDRLPSIKKVMSNLVSKAKIRFKKMQSKNINMIRTTLGGEGIWSMDITEYS